MKQYRFVIEIQSEETITTADLETIQEELTAELIEGYVGFLHIQDIR